LNEAPSAFDISRCACELGRETRTDDVADLVHGHGQRAKESLRVLDVQVTFAVVVEVLFDGLERRERAGNDTG
jgi:hypothetical protein